MKETYKRISLLLAALLVFALSYSCAPRAVGEARAKQAGLALINLAFDANETDAVVEYAKYAIEQSETEAGEQMSDASVMRCYMVSVEDGATGEVRYTAFVSATTGFAYSADRSNETLSPLTNEQLQQSKELSQLPWGEDEMLDRLYESKPAQLVYDWVTARFEQQDEVMSVTYGSMEGDWNGTQRVSMDCLVTFENGAVYVVGISWPTLEITRVEILSQPVIKGAA